MTDPVLDPAPFLPLPLATFHILLAVADEGRHGYAIIQDVEARTGGALRLSAGTLGYFIREGKHSTTAEDWKVFLDFADRRFAKSAGGGK